MRRMACARAGALGVAALLVAGCGETPTRPGFVVTEGPLLAAEFEVVSEECDVVARETVTGFLGLRGEAGNDTHNTVAPGQEVTAFVHTGVLGEEGVHGPATLSLYAPDGDELWTVDLDPDDLGSMTGAAHTFHAPAALGEYMLHARFHGMELNPYVTEDGQCIQIRYHESEAMMSFFVVDDHGEPDPPQTMAGSATGSGHTTFGGQTPDGRRFAFSAITNPNGSVGGEFQLTTAIGARIHGTVTCVRVMTPEAYGFGPMPGAWVARIGGVAGPTNVDGWAGAPVFFTVVDRGQGAAAAPDLISTLFGSVTDPSIPVDQIHCDTGMTWNFDQQGNPVIPVFDGTGALPTRVFPAERGNIQVRAH
jgi:hypothetical protein